MKDSARSRCLASAGNQVAIATVVKVEGSAPRPVGATMAVSSAGDLAGSVSGGCVETAVFEEAQEVLRTGQPKLHALRHHRRDGLGRRPGLRRHDRGLRRAGHRMTGLAPRADRDPGPPGRGAGRAHARRHRHGRPRRSGRREAADPAGRDSGQSRRRHTRRRSPGRRPISWPREQSETRAYRVAGRDEPVEVFIETFPPPPTLLIFGAVHVAQPLTRFAKALGFDVIVSDARAKLATRERFPDADRIIQGWPDETLAQVEILPNTYVAILSHDPKFDEPALVGTLDTPAAYIGAIGSRKTNEDRRRRLAEAGMSPEQIARMRAPIGLDIGAATPEEMAISILGEIIALRRGRSGGSLTYATGRIRGEGDATDGDRDPIDGDRNAAIGNGEGVAAAR